MKHACEKIIVLFSNSDIFICVLITFSFPELSTAEIIIYIP